MHAAEYERHDGLSLANLLRSGDVSPHELMACAIELAQTRGAALNSICYEQYAESFERSKTAKVTGAFAALPFLLKDSALPSTRFPASVGSRLLSGLQFRFDATLLQRFEEAGLIPFARTTVPEFCMSPTTESVANGAPTRNPWDVARSAGGSSGGAAACVAAGIVPLAHANDGGGSIRIPASCCGVYGLKPSRGLVPMGPARGEGWGGLTVEGVISRTVRDSAATLDAIGGFEPGAPYAAPPQPDSILARLTEPFDRPLRIASCVTGWSDISVTPECVAAVRRTESLLISLGHEVVDCGPPPIDYEMFVEALIDVLAANVVVTVNAVTKGRQDEGWMRNLEPALLDAYHVGTSISSEQYINAITTFHKIGRRMEKYMTGFDLLVTPTLTRPPVPLGTFSTDSDFRPLRREVARYTAFLAIINASGQPAASVPLHWSDNGLPIGVQIVGHFGQDDAVLRLSAHLETLSPWATRRPPLFNSD